MTKRGKTTKKCRGCGEVKGRLRQFPTYGTKTSSLCIMCHKRQRRERSPGEDNKIIAILLVAFTCTECHGNGVAIDPWNYVKPCQCRDEVRRLIKQLSATKTKPVQK